MRFSLRDKKVISDMLMKFENTQKKDAGFRSIGFSALFKQLSSEEKQLARAFLALDPSAYGFKGPRYGIGRSKKLVRVPKHMLRSDEIHFLPKNVFEAFKKIRIRLKRETGECLLVDSGYRSPAYQLVVLLRSLVDDKFQLNKTAKLVAFPGWSEHGAHGRQAIDFTLPYLPENTAADPMFEKTEAYRWLSRHAHEYGFSLSYPRGNKWGVAFEPWHWHYKKIKNQNSKVKITGQKLKMTSRF